MKSRCNMKSYSIFRNRKGMFFTFMSIIVIGILVLTVISDMRLTEANRIPIVRSRIGVADEFLKNLKEGFLEHALRSSASLAMDVQINRMEDPNTEGFISDVCIFDTMLLDGKIDTTVWNSLDVDQMKTINYSLLDKNNESLADNPDSSNPVAYDTQNPIVYTEDGTPTIKAMAQRFMAESSGRVNSIEVNLKKASGDDRNVIIELRKGQCKNPGMVLDTATARVTDESGSTVEAEFEHKIYLHEGTEYYLVIRASRSSGTDRITHVGIVDAEATQMGRNYTNSVASENVNGMAYESDIPKTVNAKITEYQNFVTGFLHIEPDIEIIRIDLFQSEFTGPWRVGINATVQIKMTTDLASWNLTENIVTSFSINGTDDVFYYLNSGTERHSRQISKYDIQDNEEWDSAKLLGMIRFEQYRAEPAAPNFLMRLMNVSDRGNESGMESVIRRDYTWDHDISYIDYCFFQASCYRSYDDTLYYYNVYTVSTVALPPNFKIDDYHISTYGISEEAGDVITLVCKGDPTAGDPPGSESCWPP